MDDRVKIVDHSRRHSYQILETMPTLEAAMGTGGGNTPVILVEMSAGEARVSKDVFQTLRSRMGTGGGNVPMVAVKERHILRRITPTECARLQGFPDWWTDGADGSDSAIYKMWGNGIALPCAADVIGRLAKELIGGENNDTE